MAEMSHSIPFLEVCHKTLPRLDYRCKLNFVSFSFNPLFYHALLEVVLTSYKFLSSDHAAVFKQDPTFFFFFRNVVGTSIDANNLQDK